MTSQAAVYPHEYQSTYTLSEVATTLLLKLPFYTTKYVVWQVSSFLGKRIQNVISVLEAPLSTIQAHNPHVYEVINSQEAAKRVEDYLREHDIPSSVRVIHFCRRVFCCVR